MWLHGASVGDQRALAPLVARLRAARPELRLLVTAWTAGGLAMGTQLFPDLPVHRVPLSVVWGPGRVLRRVRPRVVVFEYLELWPAWVAACRRQGVRTLVVDGRVGPRSLRIRPLLARAAAALDGFCARSPRDAGNALQLGVRPERLYVHGNAKHDGAVVPSLPSPELTRRVGPVEVVVGSLHPDEEAAALPALAASGLRALIAPRYPQRAAALIQAAERLGVEAARRSQPVDSHAQSPQWVVLDTIGELASAYALAPVAVVGGTFGRRQGQTLVEPAAHGCAVIHGPATDNIAEEVAALAGQGAWPVADWVDAFAQVHRLRGAPGPDPRPALAALRGAADRNLMTLLDLLDQPA